MFFFTQPNYAELKFHNGQTNCCYDFCGNQLLGKLVFPLASTEASLLSLGATRQRQEAGIRGEVWDGRRVVATSGRWGRWCGSDHPPVRLYVGSTEGFCHGSRTCPGCWISHSDVCRSAVSIECWCLLLIYTMPRVISNTNRPYIQICIYI